MAVIECPKCKNRFEANNGASLVSRGAAFAAGALGGGKVGASAGVGVGLATGGTGIAATGPFALVGVVIGGLGGYIAADSFRRCPSCHRVFKT